MEYSFLIYLKKVISTILCNLTNNVLSSNIYAFLYFIILQFHPPTSLLYHTPSTPPPFPFRWGKNSLGNQKARLIKLKQDQLPLPCINAEQGTLPYGIRSKQSFHALGLGPGSIARGSTQDQATQLPSRCRVPRYVSCQPPNCPSRIH